jgi:hypothetical protein
MEVVKMVFDVSEEYTASIFRVDFCPVLVPRRNNTNIACGSP